MKCSSNDSSSKIVICASCIGCRLFTLGSFTFFVADANEWWLNNKVGCMLDAGNGLICSVYLYLNNYNYN